MKKYIGIVITLLGVFATGMLYSETLFEVKDASNNKVLDVSTDGLRILNEGDTLMVISPSGVRVNLNNSPEKALSRTFAVTTTSSKNKGLSRVLEVGTQSTTMREGDLNQRYTDFSPDNLFLGLNAGRDTYTGRNNIFIGNECGTLNYYGDDNIYIGYQAGYRNDWASENIFIGNYAGYNNDTDDPFPYGSMNVFLGTYSGYSNIDGFVNTFLGYRAGEDNRGAVENTYVGAYAGSNNNSGKNVALGVFALGSSTSGTQNTAIGTYSGQNNLTGSRNVFLGYSAGYNETGSDMLYVANTNTATPLIKGIFPNSDLTFTANTVSVVHPLGETTNGLKIQTSYNSNIDSWHIYQQTDDELGLYYNTGLRGSYNVTTGAYTSVSDKKLKKNFEDIGVVTDKVLKLMPMRYNFTSQKDGEKKYIGLIAQEAEEYFPEFVEHDEESDTYTFDYAGMSVVAIQAIKEQQAEIDELKRMNDFLMMRIEAIEKKLNE